MWLLTVCAGFYMGACNQVNTHYYEDKDTCFEVRDVMVEMIEDGWAVCIPMKQLTMPKLGV